MYITRIWLENFKRHKEIEREFAPGVNAIFGPNGSGKTSIIEAIGFVLFDFSPYTQKELIRRDARKTTARVEFVAPIDNREYILERQVMRSGGGRYQLFDAATSALMCENKDDVQTRLRELLMLDPDTSFRDLFSSILGVPQGTMTAVFLAKSSKDREKVFDPLLQVEVYKRAKDDMHHKFLKPLQEQLNALQMEMGRLEENVNRLPKLQSEHKQLVASLQRNQKEHNTLKEKEPALTASLQAMRAVEEQLKQVEQEHQQSTLQQQYLKTQHAEVLEQLEQARQAQAILEQDKAHYTQHQEAEAQLRQVREKEKEFRKQQRTFQQTQNQHQRALLQWESLAQKREELQGLAQEYETLKPKMEEQERSTQLREKALQARSHLDRLQAEHKELLHNRQSLDQRVEETSRLLAELPQLQSAVAEKERIEREGKEIKAQLQTLEDQQKTHEQLLGNVRKAEEAIHQRQQQIQETRRHLDNLYKQYQPQADRLPQEEAQLEKLNKKIAQLESRREREQVFAQEVSGGVCPYFQQPCRNVPPDQRLDDFLSGQVERWGEELQRLRQRLSEVERQRDTARRAHLKMTEEGSRHQAMAESSERELRRQEEELRQLQQELRRQPDCSEAIARMSQQRQDLVNAYKEVAPLAKKAQELEPKQEIYLDLLKQKDQSDQHLKQNQNLQDSFQEEAAQLEPLTQTLKKLEADCERGRLCANLLKDQPKVENDCTTQEAQVKQLAQSLTEQEQTLQEFGDVEQELSNLQKQLDATKEAYQRYLAHQKTASQLSAREQRLKDTEQQQTETQAKLKSLTEELASLRETFQPDEYLRLQNEERNLFGRLKELERDMAHQNERKQQLDDEIQTLTKANQTLAEKLERKKKLERIEQCSQFIRGIYDRAKPEITRLLIESISEEAGRMFSQLMNNHRMHLQWKADEKDRYALFVEEEGISRSFPNLSGGEQMAAALALRMALIKELSSVRVAFLDEPTAHMDEDRRRNLASQISEIKGFQQLFVISHDDTFDSQTHHTVRVP
ncbi:MAG: SMC family ATPase [Deltaproteobacteria bacterium]|nr:MAG: SMC family ATPase [Deltaproteobacteria bacterium]